MRKDISDLVNIIVFLTSLFATVYFIVIEQPTVIEDPPGKKKKITYSAGAIIAPLICIGYFFVILNNYREIPFKLRDVDYHRLITICKDKIEDGFREYCEWDFWEKEFWKKKK